MSSLKCLNVGCGQKFHKEWTNVDLASRSQYVIRHDLSKGIPFDDDQFDVVYHSQVLEHFAQEKAPAFVSECFRVLKPGGIMRVVVPDLESIVTEYVRCLREVLENPGELSYANYDWIMLEMYDQTVRNQSGGQMARFLRQPQLLNRQYVVDRAGFVAEQTIFEGASGRGAVEQGHGNSVRRAALILVAKLKRMFSSEASALGEFRMGGEIHLWMYDRFSLTRLLEAAGFSKIEIQSPSSSNIPGWGRFELDIKDGVAFDPTSLFVEARKPPNDPSNHSVG